MAIPRYLTIDDVIALHAHLMEKGGWPQSPLLHRDKLESALARPRVLAHYEEADLARQAVGLAIGISQSQAFMDGNKRAGFVALYAFLVANNLEYVGQQGMISRWIEHVAEHPQKRRDRFEIAFAKWLRQNLIPLDSTESRH